jgi:dihydropteroate synthase
MNTPHGTSIAAGGNICVAPSLTKSSGWAALLPDRPAIMGVVNVTADSFSDGGKFLNTDTAVAHAIRLLSQGADLLDIGGESTRPGADPVPEAVEIDRVVPVIHAIRAAGITCPISIDTTKAAVAAACLDAGANAINDVTALTGDPAMAGVIAKANAPVALMHMAGTPRTMQGRPQYGAVVAEVYDYLDGRIRAAVAAGIPRTHLAIDPGIGFGKTVHHNLLLLKHLERFADLGVPLLLGTSKKSFIGAVLGGDRGALTPTDAKTATSRPVEDRAWGTAATVALGIAKGANILRVHDVAAMADVAALSHAILRA